MEKSEFVRPWRPARASWILLSLVFRLLRTRHACIEPAVAAATHFTHPIACFASGWRGFLLILRAAAAGAPEGARNACCFCPCSTCLFCPWGILQCDADVEVQLRAIELCRAMVQTRAFADLSDGEALPGDGRSKSELRQYIRSHASTIWHPVGTCRMGRDRMAVVDPQLRVHGLEGLRVADASIMPAIVSANPNAAIIMIGEKAADLVKGETQAAPIWVTRSTSDQRLATANREAVTAVLP